MTEDWLQVESSETGKTWVIRTSAIDDPVLARAVGHWLSERFETSFELSGTTLVLSMPEREPMAGAVSWIIGEIQRGRPGFDALGFASTHLEADETRSGLEVLRERSGTERSESKAPDPAAQAPDPAAQAPDPAPHAARRGRRGLEPIGSEQVGGEEIRGEKSVARAPAAAAQATAPLRRVPDVPVRALALEPIGESPRSLPEPTKGLPAAGDPGLYELVLVDAGPESERTGGLLAAALGIPVEDARAMCTSLPTAVLTGSTARAVRRVETVVRSASGASFEVSELP